MARVEFNAKDHRTRHVTGCLVLAATFNNKELLKGIVVTGLAKVNLNLSGEATSCLFVATPSAPAAPPPPPPPDALTYTPSIKLKLASLNRA